MDWFKIGKVICQDCILSPCLINWYTEYIMGNAGLNDSQARIKIAGRNINNLKYADDTSLRRKVKRNWEPLVKVKEESEKACLKLNIQKTKVMASGPNTSWQIDGETVADFILGGSKITAYGHCSHEIKRHLLLGRKSMTYLDTILKGKDITLLTKVHLVKAMVFPVVMYRYKHRRIDAFELWSCRRVLDCKEIHPVHPKGNQSWIFIGRIDAKAKKNNSSSTCCEEPNHWKIPWCWEKLKVGGERDDRGWDGWVTSPSRWTWVWISSRNW